MKHRSVFLSPIGFVLQTGLFLGLGLSLWHSGGLAFSPGALSAINPSDTELGGFRSHAAFEMECRRCHQPLKTRQADLCLDCHTSVATQVEAGEGLHSQIEHVERCAVCHSDHRGRQFDMAKDAWDDFDHNRAGFSLIRHQLNYNAVPMECESCHINAPDFTASEQVCSGCHANHDAVFTAQHTLDFGASCLACHDGQDRMMNFDHSQTMFSLDGQHVIVGCVECHSAERGSAERGSGSQLAGISQSCAACHTEPDIHRGLFDSDCKQCHTPQEWKPATLDDQPFDHALQTRFSLARHALDYANQPMTCRSCHLIDMRTTEIETCIACHADHDAAFLDEHQQQFGSACLDCHDGVDRLSNFDHQAFFPLDGQHAEIECTSCHEDKVFRGTPLECVSCHAEPQIHAGSFGLQCQYCHTAIGWTPARLQIHPFPLSHGKAPEGECQVCHSTTYASYTCYSCHEHQPEAIAVSHTQLDLSFEKLADCAQCHLDGRRLDGK